ncbi:NAD(P)H-hydrate epimerase [Gemmatimonadota bacterium]
MLEIDAIAVEESRPSLLQMMETAGRSLAELVLRNLARMPSQARILVLAGKGGNGGGGVCAARHLASRVYEIDLCLADPHGLSPAAKSQLHLYRPPALSLDLPSGVDADSGEAPGAYVTAEATLTLHMPKPGLANPVAGTLWLADLGIPAGVTCRLGIELPGYGPGFLIRLERP